MCVFVQGAKSGGGVSAPIAQRIMEETMALEKGFEVQLVSLEPAAGNFTFVDMVDFKKSAVPEAIASQLDADQERADHTDAQVKKRERQVKTAPDIRAAADARGRVQGKVAPPKPQGEKRNFFERVFGPKPSSPRPAPRPSGR